MVGGRGEYLHPLSPLPPLTVLLVRPPVSVSTAEIYAGLTAESYSDGGPTWRLASLAYAAPPSRWPLVNALQPVTCAAYPVVEDVLELLRGLDVPAQMCGSGPTCFALFSAGAQAEEGARLARERGWETWITTFTGADEVR